MPDYTLNIGGSEWMIIIFVALVLILGTGRLPGVAKKMGKVVNEYNKAKNEIQEQIRDATEETPKISGPVESEREKLEMIAKSAGIKIEGKTDKELRDGIASTIGQKETSKDESVKNDTSEKKPETGDQKETSKDESSKKDTLEKKPETGDQKETSKDMPAKKQ